MFPSIFSFMKFFLPIIWTSHIFDFRNIIMYFLETDLQWKMILFMVSHSQIISLLTEVNVTMSYWEEVIYYHILLFSIIIHVIFLIDPLTNYLLNHELILVIISTSGEEVLSPSVSLSPRCMNLLKLSMLLVHLIDSSQSNGITSIDKAFNYCTYLLIIKFNNWMRNWN